MKMETNTACISLEDLGKLYADRERLVFLNEALYHMAGVLRKHLAGPYDCWTRDIGGFELKERDDLIEELMSILFYARPSFKEIMEKEALRIREEAEKEAQALSSAENNQDYESRESDREAEDDRIYHEMDEKG